MSATQVLREEHEGILAMLAVVDAAAERLSQGKEIPADLFANSVDFFRNFADQCHHEKEERELFPKLVEHGIPNEGGPIGVMLAEHERGRAHVRALREAAEQVARGDATAVPALVSHAHAYVDLLRAHIDKENDILFVMADRVLSPDEQNTLQQAFERIERDHIGPGVHERYHAMIGEYQAVAAGWNTVPVAG